MSNELNLNSKPVEFEDSDVNYNSYLFSTPSTDITHSHRHHHVHIHQHVVSRSASVSVAANGDLNASESHESALPAQSEGVVRADSTSNGVSAVHDEEKQYPMSGLNGIADDLFREVRAPRDLMADNDQDEKTLEDSQQQSYRGRQFGNSQFRMI